MNFLAPLFLLGMLGVALPILFHLIRRTARDRVWFSSLMFLRPSPPRVTRRSRLENLLLLLLRCLVLCVLAFGFARPFLHKPPMSGAPGVAGKQIVLLLDISASMRRDHLWPQAVAKAKFWLEKTGPADRVAILAFARQVQLVLPFDQWSALPRPDRVPTARQHLQTLQPGWAATHLGTALLTALEILDESDPPTLPAGPRQIILITDLQEGVRLDELQGLEWPAKVQLLLEPVRAQRPSNASLQILPEQFGPLLPDRETNVHVRVVNAAESAREQFQIRWVTRQNQTVDQPGLEIYVAPGQSRVVPMPLLADPAALSHLQLAGDEEEFDNRAYYVPVRQETRHVLFFGPDAAADPAGLLYYLRRAFPETPRHKTVITSHRPDQPVAPAPMPPARLMILSGNPGQEHLAFARRFLAGENTVLFVLRGAADAAALADLLGINSMAAEEAAAGQYAMLGRIDFSHPLLTPFSDPRYSDFTKIHFWKYRRLETDSLPDARAVAVFDNGDPALLQVPAAAGSGTLYVLASGWHPADSQLALSSKFVPLLYSLLELAGGATARRDPHVVGDLVPVPKPGPGERLLVRPPAGPEQVVGANEPFFYTDQPGLYTLLSETGPTRFAVNLAAEESKTTPLPFETLERLGLSLQARDPDSTGPMETERLYQHALELESRQKLWRWLILTALLLLVLETWLAGRRSRGAAGQVQST